MPFALIDDRRPRMVNRETKEIVAPVDRESDGIFFPLFFPLSLACSKVNFRNCVIFLIFFHPEGNIDFFKKRQ